MKDHAEIVLKIIGKQKAIRGRPDFRHSGIVIGQYEIRHWDADSFWIEHESGEGMHCTATRLADCIDAFYKESF